MHACTQNVLCETGSGKMGEFFSCVKS